MKKILSLFLGLILALSLCVTAYADQDAPATPSGIPLSEMEDFIDQYMAQWIGISSPGAAVVVVRNGAIIFSKGYGLADVETGAPVDSAATVFEYGSISKLFVYTTIMRLVEQGKLDLEADIRGYLPENFLKRIRYNQPITLLHIMNHTTGFEDYLFDVVLANSSKRPAMEETLIHAQPLQVYEPGTVSAYSNYAVALAAYIAERMIGQDFYKYLMDTVFEPLDMDHTSAEPMLADKPELLDAKANGYLTAYDGSFVPGGWSYIPLYPIGGVNGTADDLARFAMALMPGQGEASALFGKNETLHEMLAQTWQMGPGLPGFAHGFIEFFGEKRALGHGGNTAYFSTQLNIVPEERFGVVILTNAANEMEITSGLTQALIGRKDKAIVAAGESLPDSKEVEGTYIGARRSHSSFLELYQFLSLLRVRSLEPNKIELSLGGQSATFIQTSPYVYDRTEADGALFQYHFDTIYFQVENGRVFRMSGDFLPLPAGRTMPWLIISLLAAAFSAAYLILSLVSLALIALMKLLRRKSAPAALSGCTQTLAKYMVLGGAALLVNNAVMALRMLINNYRSFSEFKLQILLNYPLAGIVAVLVVLSLAKWKNSGLTKAQKVFSAATMLTAAVFVITLISWKFFNL